MAATLKLEIVTPDAKTYSEDVEMVTLPGVEGEMGIYPQHVPLMTQIVAGARHFCARISDGTVRCWGDDARGQLGLDPAGGDADAGATVTGLTGVTQISAAGTTTCARLEDQSVRCWGGNDHGQLGRALDPPTDEDPHPIPERVAIDAVARVDVGERSVCSTTAAGGARGRPREARSSLPW